MSAREFSLVGVWRLRKATRDDRRLALAATLANQAEAFATLARLAAEIDQFQTRRHTATRTGVVRLDQIQDDLRVEELLRTERQRYLHLAEQVDAETIQRQDELAQAEAEWRAIDWLRERRSTPADPAD